MVNVLAKRCLLSLVGTSIVFLLEMMLPSVAQAECGDYVTMRTESPQHNSSNIENPSLPPIQTPCSHSKHDQNGSFPGDLPCRGPGCSRRGTPPLLPMKVAPQRQQQDQAVALVELARYPEPKCPGLVEWNDFHLVSPFLLRLFRPPRVG